MQQEKAATWASLVAGLLFLAVWLVPYFGGRALDIAFFVLGMVFLGIRVALGRKRRSARSSDHAA